MTQAVLEFDGVVKRFGKRTILDGISMQVQTGEIVCFIGPSGTGKSTLLRCVNGLEDIQGGELRFEGRPVLAHERGAITAVRRRIGMIFQHFNLYPHLTALENVVLASVVVHKQDRKTVEARAKALFERVRLSHRMNAYPAQMSGGEQQRVAVARALAPHPAILVADEPTGNLDEETGKQIIELLFAGHKERGTTLILVTHDSALAARCERVVRLRSGRIDGEGIS